MGNIQNKMNGALGTTAAALAMASHINEQNKANELKVTELEAEKIDAEAEAWQAKTNLDKFNKDFSTDQTNEKVLQETIKNDHPKDSDDLIEKALKNKREAAVADQYEAFGNKQAYEGNDEKQLSTLNNNLELANKALTYVDSEIESRNKLKFDVKSRLAKQDVLAKKLQVLK